MKYLLLLLFLPSTAFAQTIEVNSTQPCFLNYTAGYQLLENCGFADDYLRASLLGFEWITGGYFSLVFAGILVLFTWIKYHKAIYPLIIGVSILPISFFLVPDTIVASIIFMVVVVVGVTVYKTLKHNASEY